MRTPQLSETEIKMYSVICRNDGIKAKEIAKLIGKEHDYVNRMLYGSPFIHELCYRDADFFWHGLIRQQIPHTGLGDFCGYYSDVQRFLDLSEEEWMEELLQGCQSIGRNLNDTRGLMHSFRDTREVMRRLFSDLGDMQSSDFRKWEICFELRIKRARYIRIYTDVLVITDNKVFSLEFKMKDTIDPDEERQAVKYAKYLEIIFGPEYDVISALVLTKASDLYAWQPLPGSTAQLPVCSGDMLFNLFDEYLNFLD